MPSTRTNTQWGASSPVFLPRDLAVRFSVIESCQLRCRYCLPERDEDGTSPCHSSHQTDTPSAADLLRLVQLLHEVCRIRRLRFTGGEPLLRKDLPELMTGVADLGIRDLALTTNAQLLAPQLPALKAAGLDRLNISLDSLDPQTYRELTRGGRLEATLEGIEAAQGHGYRDTKLNMVVLRGVNAHEVGALLDFALFRGLCLRFLELMPVGEGARTFDEQFVRSSETMDSLRETGFVLDPMQWDPRETSRDFQVTAPDGKRGRCGFISPTSQPFCGECGRVRLTADGGLHGCLARAGAVDLLPLLSFDNDEAARFGMAEAVSSAFRRKTGGERFEQTVSSMAQLGG